jgi:hypothetical protein
MPGQGEERLYRMEKPRRLCFLSDASFCAAQLRPACCGEISGFLQSVATGSQRLPEERQAMALL